MNSFFHLEHPLLAPCPRKPHNFLAAGTSHATNNAAKKFWGTLGEPERHTSIQFFQSSFSSAKFVWHEWWWGRFWRLLASRDCACLQNGSFRSHQIKQKSMTNCKIVFLLLTYNVLHAVEYEIYKYQKALVSNCKPRVALVLFQLPVLDWFWGLATKFPNTHFTRCFESFWKSPVLLWCFACLIKPPFISTL